MPGKKKKYNARFPPARIKKIMQTDEDVGKVAAAVPVIISRALELFIESLILKSNDMTQSRNARTLSTAHIKHIIESEKKFDFLRDLVAGMPNMAELQQTEEDGDSQSGVDSADPAPCSGRQPRQTAARSNESDPALPTKRPRGRPRKQKSEQQLPPKKRGRKKKKKEETTDDSATEDANSNSGSADSTEEVTRLAVLQAGEHEPTSTMSQGQGSTPFARYEDSTSHSDSSPHNEQPHPTYRATDSQRDEASFEQSRTKQRAHSPTHNVEQRDALIDHDSEHESELRNKLVRDVMHESDQQKALRLDSIQSGDQRISLRYSEYTRDQQNVLRLDKHDNEQGDTYKREITPDREQGDKLRASEHETVHREALRLGSMQSRDESEAFKVDGAPISDQRSMLRKDEGEHRGVLRKNNRHESRQGEVSRLDHGDQRNALNQKDESAYDGHPRDAEYYSRLHHSPGQGIYPSGPMTHPGLPPHLPPGVCPYPVPTHPGLAPNINTCSCCWLPPWYYYPLHDWRSAGVPDSYPSPLHCPMPPAPGLSGQPPCSTLGTPPYSLPLPFYGSYGPSGPGLPHPPHVTRTRPTADREDSDS